MAARAKGGAKAPPEPTPGTVSDGMPTWPDVEHLAPDASDIINAFRGKNGRGRVPPPDFIDRIRFFVAVERLPTRRDRRSADRHAIQLANEAKERLRAACTAIERASAALDALDGRSAQLIHPAAAKLVDGLALDGRLLRHALDPSPVEKEWREIARLALLYVVDPSVQAAAANPGATADSSLRVRVLTAVLQMCGVSSSEASPAAIREWLKGARFSPSAFLAYSRHR